MHTQQSLREHLLKEHKQNPFSDYLREIVYGGTDGIVTTFAVVAGFSGAKIMGGDALTLSFITVLLFGLANLFADGLSMGLSNFLSIRAEKDVYARHKSKERKEIKENPDMEEEETLVILREKGFSDEQAKQLLDIFKTNEEYWVNWMMNHELELPNPEGVNPLLTGMTTLVSFLIFGAIPLLPYMLPIQTAEQAFSYSIAGALAALIILGAVKGRVIGTKILTSVAEVVIIGSVAASVAFFVGTFFRF